MGAAKNFDAIIIGGGASGLAAAVTYLRRPDAGALLLIEAKEECGRKILATGNGRCNVSNLSADGFEDIEVFFESLGVLFRVEEMGRVYPMSGKASSVRDALVYALGHTPGQAAAYPAPTGKSTEKGKPMTLSVVRRPSAATVEVQVGRRVASVEKSADGVFSVKDGEGRVSRARHVLIATGGKAGPAFGSYGDGYAFARAFGHKIETIHPSLVPLAYAEEEREALSRLKGVRARVGASLEIDGWYTTGADGEVQFTADALSGIVIFDISTAMPKSIIEGKPSVCVRLDLVPGAKKEELQEMMRLHDGFWLEGVMDKRLSDWIVERGKGDIERIALYAKCLSVPISGTKGWKDAQVTRGGVVLDEVSPRTGESRLCPGLFFAGEVLDEDFVCGGFHLSQAWTTGMRAGAHL
ncbi:MAG: NAD(P)/FAD-dependent oxidoreductase [Clostridiales Family XIII bacterium]|jgi:predicted Rossmann fold flavoprotein|nr:NAD(P)/FAD-dependent oxidoreductase [Clostridiales Family XIII bacterium]